MNQTPERNQKQKQSHSQWRSQNHSQWWIQNHINASRTKSSWSPSSNRQKDSRTQKVTSRTKVSSQTEIATSQTKLTSRTKLNTFPSSSWRPRTLSPKEKTIVTAILSAAVAAGMEQTDRCGSQSEERRVMECPGMTQDNMSTQDHNMSMTHDNMSMQDHNMSMTHDNMST